MALETGRQLIWLSRRLGQSSLKVTSDVYGPPVDALNEEHVALLSQIRTALERRTHEAAIGRLEGVVVAVAFAEEDSPRGHGRNGKEIFAGPTRKAPAAKARSLFRSSR